MLLPTCLLLCDFPKFRSMYWPLKYQFVATEVYNNNKLPSMDVIIVSKAFTMSGVMRRSICIVKPNYRIFNR